MLFEDLIKQYVYFPGKPSVKGWHSLNCPMCTDKKKRGAFLFNSDSVIYKCFNCPFKAVYFEHSPSIHDNVIELMKAVNIPDSEINKLYLVNLGNKHSNTSGKHIIPTSIIKPIETPDHFYSLSTNNTDVWSQVACAYLMYDRKVNVDDYTFFLSTNEKWKGRLIIPYYFQNNLVYYQGRDLTDKKKLKYKNASVSETNMLLYGYDNIALQDDSPLFVVEGFFDALLLKGVAILGNNLTPEKINYINRSPRKKIYIPDRYGDGKQAAIAAIKAGWSVSIPDTPSCKDVNDIIKKYGKMFAIKSIMERTYSGDQALINVT